MKRELNPSPNDRILDRSKLKAFADDKINLTEKLKLVFRRVENMVTSIFSFSHSVFKSLPFRVVKSWDCVVKS